MLFSLSRYPGEASAINRSANFTQSSDNNKNEIVINEGLLFDLGVNRNATGAASQV